MKERFNIENSNYEYIKDTDLKKISDQILIEKVQSTYKFLRLSEIYLNDVKDDYGKKKIASLRVDFVRHQLDLLMRECFARKLKQDLINY